LRLEFHPTIKARGERDFVVRLRAWPDGDVVGKEIWFRITGVPKPSDAAFAEASLALGLIPAMKLGEPLRVAGSAFPGLRRNISRFQEVFHCWYKEYTEIPVEVNFDRLSGPAMGSGVGLYFSGGVDSIYSLIRHREEITHLIFVHGCDIRLDQIEFRKLVSQRLRESSIFFGKQLVEIETNLLEFSDEYGHWGFHYHGSALAGIAMLLCGVISKVYIASSGAWDDLARWGSHQVTDDLWGHPLLEVAHDGADLHRTEKILFLAQQPEICDHFRVCWENVREAYNCGKCEKCLRTMVALEIAGVLRQCRAFPPMDLRLIADELMHPPRPYYLDLWADLRQRAEAAGNLPELAAALRKCCNRNANSVTVSQFGRENRQILESERWQKLLPKVRNKLWQNMAENDPKWMADKTGEYANEHSDAILEALWKKDRHGVQTKVAKLSRQHRWQKLKRLFGRPNP
jgi:hypothetical protein